MANANSTDDAARYNVEADIRRWLSEEGWQLSPHTQPDLRFAVVADDGSGRRLVIGQQAQRPDRIIIEAVITLTGDHASKFPGLPQKKRQDFLWDLRFDLLRTDVEFSGLSDPLERVIMSQPIYFDALSKDLFMQRLSEVKKALLLVLWKMGRLMEEPPPQMGFRKG